MLKSTQSKHQYFFVDEAGDPTFFDKHGRNIVGKEGCSKILLLGLIRTDNPDELRKAVLTLRKEIAEDEYLRKIPSIKKTVRAFHAKDDCPEVREKFYKLIVKLNFKAEFFVARKLESVFRNKHKAKQHLFYDDLIIKLFENKLHKAERNFIYYAKRGNKTRQEPFEDAVQAAILTFENKWNQQVKTETSVHPQTPSGEPCLQIIDYMNWTVFRAFSRGEERYYKFVEDKVSLLVDLYDFKKYKIYPENNYYSKRNKFAVNKISPL